MENREQLRLEKGWMFHKGDLSVLPEERTHTDLYSFAKEGGCKGPAARTYSMDDWLPVEVPHDWVVSESFDKEEAYAHGSKARGKAWYRIQFPLGQEDMGKQLLLEFDGVTTHTEVYMNGTLVKRNFCGYTGFEVDISDFVTFGAQTNTLAVRVDAETWEGWWYEGAGIYRDVWLVKKAPLHIAYNGIWVKPEKVGEGDWTVPVETVVENSLAGNREYTLLTEIMDEEGNVAAREESSGGCEGYSRQTVCQKLNVKQPKLWSDKHPVMYRLRTVLMCGQEKDCVDTNFGFRTICVDADQGFFLNGHPTKLKGVCAHQDHAGVGTVVPYAVEEYRIGKLKEMGCNAYRCAHGMPSTTILDLCDKHGLLVMDENRNFNSAQEGIEQISHMVLRDRNHPSVVLYSVFNEEPLQGTAQGRRIASRLAAKVKQLDDTRPLLGAMNGGFMEEEGCATVFDVAGFNYFTDSYDEFHKKYPEQPLVGSETNSHFVTRGVYETDIEKCRFDNYDVQCAPWGDSVRGTWQAVNSRAYVMGMFAWTGFDYRGEPSPCEWPSISSHFGIMDTCGFPKDIYFLYQAYWLERPILHILPHWNFLGDEGVEKNVMTFSNCDEIELFLNEVSLGKQKNEMYQQCTWKVPYQPGILRAVGLKDGKEIVQERITTSAARTIVLTCEKDVLYCDGRDAAVIDVSVVDPDGIPVPDADNMIQFEITGSGEILGVGNGDPSCHEEDFSDKRSLFNGRCQVIIRNNMGMDKVTVKAVAEGLVSAEVSLNILNTEFIPYVKTSKDMVISNWRVSHTAVSEKPDPTITLAACDMNTLEPVSFNGKQLPQLDEKYGCYVQYRTKVNVEQLEKANSLYFSKVTGYVWVYFNGAYAGEKDCIFGGQFEIPINQKPETDVEITVIIKSNNKAIPYAGIQEAVLLKL
ncbi:beta-galactosidase GalA [Robinsoniella sp. KNHs210]|uniref:beta-galactosidase GalA n=1 Tax=Robinsoniella sp. KNHs210 TaxID=1469950 RepID=UPI000B202738|nr:beta-galactosidase GalA [Robinsoniella sp. KNHs210]